MTVQPYEKFKVLLDSLGDNSYAYDLTDRVMQMSWHNGAHEAYEMFASKNSATMLLDNRDGALSSGLFGDFTFENRTETITAEALTNGSFTAWTGATPDSWTKVEATLAVTETASGGGAGTGALHVTGSSGYASVAQFVGTNKKYEVVVVVSEFSGTGHLIINLADSSDFIIRTPVIDIDAVGTYTFRMDTLERAYFELYARRDAGTFTITVDSVSVKRVDVTYGTVSEVQNTILGDDILTNGAFSAWSGGMPTGWSSLHTATISECGTGEDHTGAGTGSANLYTSPDTQSDLYQAIGTSSGHHYRIDIVVSLLDPTVTLHVRGYTSLNEYVFALPITTTGTHTFFIQVTNTLPVWIVILHNSTALDATIDSISMKPATFVTEYVQGEVDYTIAPDLTATFPKVTGRGTLVKILASYQDIANEQYWIGKLQYARPSVGSNSDQIIELQLTDWADQLLDAQFHADYLENCTADEAILAALNKSKAVTYPNASSYWLWGSQASSIWDISTTFYDIDDSGFDVGDYTFEFVGDNTQLSDKGTNLQAYIRDVLTAENGDCRFWWDGRTSRFMFAKRRRDALNTTVSGYFLPNTDGEISSGEMSTSKDLRNVQQVFYQPRTIGSAGSILYTNPSVPITLLPLQRMDITVRYSDPSVPSARVGGKDFITPLMGTDFAFNSRSDGTGSNYRRFIAFSVEFGAAAAKIHIRNTSNRITVYCTLLKLRGTPIKTYTPSMVEERDALSIEANDYQYGEDVQALFVGSERDARLLAQYLVGKFKNPIRRLHSITFRADNDYLIRQSLNRNIGDRIHVRDEHNKHEADYIVVGESHNYDAESLAHDVTYILKPAGVTTFWIWDSARWDLTTTYIF